MFETADEVESVCHQMRQADFPRSQNRARINELFNGFPPYTQEEADANGINVNINPLTGTRMAHDARSQFYQAFLKPGNYFTARTDMGAAHRRSTRSTVVTKEINRIMKRSLPYFEKHRSCFALDVLHGVGPGVFEDRETWCPDAAGIDDVLMGANVLLTDIARGRVPFFAIYKSLTAPQLIRMTRGPKSDPGWNKPLVEECIEWIDQESASLVGTNWPDIWSPEKMSERVKSDGGFYAGDIIPTLNVWDFYFWNDSDKKSGWNRRMVLDAWSTPTGNSGGTRRTGKPFDGARNQFLYNPGKRKYGSQLSEIITFQFADLSAVAPFRYHSVRSLGFLMYSVCHLQNRLWCKFNEATFESLMMYFRVKSLDDSQRVLKVDLINKGLVDDTMEFIKAQDRYQVNADLVKLALNENDTIISRNSSSYTSNPSAPADKREKTKFEVMSEVNAMTSLVAAGLLQAYAYQNIEYREIFRRFCRDNSSDPDVRTFQANCLRQGVPRNMMNLEAWDIEPERVMGSGNKTMEMAIAQQLLQMRNLYDPEPQRQILRDVTLAITDDPGRAESLVPDKPLKVTDSVHDAELVAGTLMMGLPVSVKTGMNHIEYVETLLTALSTIIQKAKQMQGDMATAEQITGMQNVAGHIAQHLQIIAQDENEKPRVKQYGDALGKMMNEVRAFAQRLQEQMAEQNGQQQGDPEAAAKIEAMMMQAQAKSANTRESHAQRTAQRQAQWEMEQQRGQQSHQLEMQKESQRAELDIQKQAAKAQIDITKARAKPEKRDRGEE